MNPTVSPLLSAKNLELGYKNGFSLKKINLRIFPGQFLAIIGPNGSGKSTLLKCLSRGIKNYSGSIKIFSREIKTFPTKQLARKLAVTLQNPFRPENLTVLEYVLLGRYPWLGYLGFFNQDDYSISSRSMKLCGVESMAEHKLQYLSGGEWQRVILAQALCQIHDSAPAIMALDEISSSMDPAWTIETFSLLSSLVSSSRAIMAVVHDCNLAALFATHILGLKDGQIKFSGKVKDVFTSENLGLLYDMEIGILRHPDFDLPQMYPHLVNPPALHNSLFR